MVAWCTPGAAVLASRPAAGFGMAEAVGAFIVCALLIALAGATGWFERVMDRIPMAIASALLAGVLARFGLDAFVALQSALPLVLLMLRRLPVGRAPVAALRGAAACWCVGIAFAGRARPAAPGRRALGPDAAGVHDARLHAGRRRSAWRCRCSW